MHRLLTQPGYRLYPPNSPEAEALLAEQRLGPADLKQALARLESTERTPVRTIVGINQDGVFGVSRAGWPSDLPDACQEPFIPLLWLKVHELLGRVPEVRPCSTEHRSIPPTIEAASLGSTLWAASPSGCGHPMLVSFGERTHNRRSEAGKRGIPAERNFGMLAMAGLARSRFLPDPDDAPCGGVHDVTRAMHGLLVCSAAATALLLGGATPARGQAIPLDEAEVLAELNDTDGDLGFHALIDAEAWDRLRIRSPDRRLILAVGPRRSLARQGLTELFFESAEPEFDELSPEEFFERFPEGIYRITGRTIEGDTLAGTARFSHRMPAPVGNVAVSGTALVEDLDCDAEVPVVAEPVAVSWDPVTRSHPEIGDPTDAPIRIDRYQLVVEREEPALLVYSVDLPGDLPAYEVTVPAEFIALGEEFKYEIVTRARNGNQTALESCFAVD